MILSQTPVSSIDNLVVIVSDLSSLIDGRVSWWQLLLQRLASGYSLRIASVGPNRPNSYHLAIPHSRHGLTCTEEILESYCSDVRSGSNSEQVWKTAQYCWPSVNGPTLPSPIDSATMLTNSSRDVDERKTDHEEKTKMTNDRSELEVKEVMEGEKKTKFELETVLPVVASSYRDIIKMVQPMIWNPDDVDSKSWFSTFDS